MVPTVVKASTTGLEGATSVDETLLARGIKLVLMMGVKASATELEDATWVDSATGELEGATWVGDTTVLGLLMPVVRGAVEL